MRNKSPTKGYHSTYNMALITLNIKNTHMVLHLKSLIGYWNPSVCGDNLCKCISFKISSPDASVNYTLCGLLEDL